MCGGRSARTDRPDRPPPPADPHHAVVVEHGDAVGGQPDVALETGRAETKAQREGIERVLGGMGASAPVGERDRVLEQRREPLLHNVR